jgi:histidinol-phosphate aminotransferase
VVVKRDENFAIKTSMVKKAVTLKTKLIFITNPNAPSGNLTPQRDIEEILKIGLPTVIDEAYYEFCGQTALPLMKNYPNLMVIRTFSKWAGLAGLRMGYGVFSTALAKVVMKIKEPYSVSVAAQIAAKETFEDMVLQTKKIELIKTERERLYGQLKELGWLKPYPSVANFILCYIKDGRAKEITLALKQKGILVRYFERAELKDYLRISVGKPQETDILIEALREIGE